MLPIRTLSAAACAALIATAAPAQQTAPSAPAGEEGNGGASAPAKSKKICRAGDAPDTGSRVPSRRVCKTKEQWEKDDKARRD